MNTVGRATALLVLFSFSPANSGASENPGDLVRGATNLDHGPRPILRESSTASPSLQGLDHKTIQDPGSADIYLPPGDFAAFFVDIDTGEILAEVPDTPALTDSALEACALAPAWLRNHLALTLSYLDTGDQDTYAQTILDLADTRAIDELAFTIAATAPEELSMTVGYYGPDVLVENALAIYENDDGVPFADLVDEGVPGVDDDYYTTVTYTYLDESGNEATWTLPRYYYYWFVVHPKLDMETALFWNPEDEYVTLPPEGLFWRSWFPYSAQDPEARDYRIHYLQEVPNAVSDDEPDAIGASGYLGDFEIDPLVVVADSDDRPVMAEMDYGSGTVVATTMPLEQGMALGMDDLLENLVLYVQRRDTLTSSESTLILVESPGPDGTMGREWAQLLEAQERSFQMAAPDEDTMATLADHEKLVLPSGGSLEFYQALSSYEKEIEDFVNGGGTLDIMVDPTIFQEAGLDSYTFPGGFTAYFESVQDLSFVGYPVLGEVLANTTALWDLQQYDGLSGERALEGGEIALDVIGWWTAQNLWDNVSEYAATHDDYDGSRYVWPELILQNHFGNCGELEDMNTAAMRTNLIATVNSQSIEDHVWSEFFFLDQWHAFQVSWSDGPTYIDYGGVAYDQEYGGGKNVSSIKAFFGNGKVESDHLSLYSNTVTIDVSVTDGTGLPVDGATVVVFSQNYYYDYLVEPAAWGHTDQQGQVSLTLGDLRDYWVMIRADIGGETVAWPFDIDDSTTSSSSPLYLLVTELPDPDILESESTSGQVFQVAHQFDQLLGAPQAQDAASSGQAQVSLELELELEQSFLDVPDVDSYVGWMASLYYAYGGRLIDPLEEPGTVDIYVVDQGNYDLFAAGQPFQALYTAGDQSSLQESLSLSTDEDLVVLVSNQRSTHHTHFGSFSVTRTGTTWAEEDLESGGCSCASSRPALPGSMLLLAMGSLVALARRQGTPRG